MSPLVAIIIPSPALVHANFAMSLAGVTAMTNARFALFNIKGTDVVEARTRGALQAQKMKADYLCFLDSDMSFPPNTLTRLLAADRDIVGANYVRRTPPHDQLASGAITQPNGLVSMERLPAGIMLIKTSVFGSLPEPWFERVWAKEERTTEDYYFCDLARKHGFKVWMDIGLSLEVVHWGENGFRWTGDGYETLGGLNG